MTSMLDEQDAVDTNAGKERDTPKKQRIWNRCGVACAVCGKDQWWVFQGFSRCDCGQVLWVAREGREGQHPIPVSARRGIAR